MLQLITPIRGTDGYGSGEFGASRGSRTHNGVDYPAYSGSLLLSIVRGRVTKLGWCYKGNDFFRYVEVTDRNLLRHRFMYDEPDVKPGELVEVNPTVDTRLIYTWFTVIPVHLFSRCSMEVLN